MKKPERFPVFWANIGYRKLSTIVPLDETFCLSENEIICGYIG